ncbi:MAG: hypothetical protein A2381_12420 [Bdellovibrionales bacterium RIFOXYB1_FULL_37_110]|nr:MAG: hypothetical protein A2181_05700 [Bdellovibrionales bacterium RIFOXYA1_FULL_38_20]OFZ47349.1 MAG: hypothetical protein A2417_12010 [Bdellovibrionales bacterium RIFOXYC1_FULL_37_79]OFZ58520.1 MAG: hypothetical protein A2381_12420 [Bdellovibrionales bacterium RIFOXYB1_FULL_37_110]OFZ63568.1 MAG: hypothetical protein A2577_08570 [Bdellovibrionales bacterium RIFOXYD1_FULL_36_51]
MKFEEIDIAGLEGILQGLKKADTKLYVWNCHNDSITKAEVVLENYNKIKKYITCKPTEGSAYYLADMVTGMGKLNFYIPDKSIYFISELKMLKEELVISWPEKLYLNDRREIPRTEEFSSVVEVEFEFDKRKYKKNCFDLGIGGFSIILSAMEKYGFKKGDVIPFINLYIGREKNEISGKIQSIDVVDPQINQKYSYKVTRVSLRFIEPDQILVKRIKSLIKNYQLEQ